MASFRGQEHRLGKYLTTSIITELKWWQTVLEDPDRYRQLKPRGELINHGIYVDASTDWGIGIWIRSKFAAYRLKEGVTNVLILSDTWYYFLIISFIYLCISISARLFRRAAILTRISRSEYDRFRS